MMHVETPQQTMTMLLPMVFLVRWMYKEMAIILESQCPIMLQQKKDPHDPAKRERTISLPMSCPNARQVHVTFVFSVDTQLVLWTTYKLMEVNNP